jgi:hypothetical protein
MILISLLVQLAISFAVLLLVVSLFFPGDFGRRIRGIALGIFGAWLLVAITVQMAIAAFRTAPFSCSVLLLLAMVVAYFVIEAKRRLQTPSNNAALPRVGGKRRVQKQPDVREALRSMLKDDSE